MPQNTLQYLRLNSVFSEHIAQTMVFISNEKGSPIGLPFSFGYHLPIHGVTV